MYDLPLLLYTFFLPADLKTSIHVYMTVADLVCIASWSCKSLLAPPLNFCLVKVLFSESHHPA